MHAEVEQRRGAKLGLLERRREVGEGAGARHSELEGGGDGERLGDPREDGAHRRGAREGRLQHHAIREAHAHHALAVHAALLRALGLARLPRHETVLLGAARGVGVHDGLGLGGCQREKVLPHLRLPHRAPLGCDQHLDVRWTDWHRRPAGCGLSDRGVEGGARPFEGGRIEGGGVGHLGVLARAVQRKPARAQQRERVGPPAEGSADLRVREAYLAELGLVRRVADVADELADEL